LSPALPELSKPSAAGCPFGKGGATSANGVSL